MIKEKQRESYKYIYAAWDGGDNGFLSGQILAGWHRSNDSINNKSRNRNRLQASLYLHSYSGGSTPCRFVVYDILHKEQKFLWTLSSPRAYPTHITTCEQLLNSVQNELQWKWSSWWVSSWWYRYRPKPNRAQALQNASSSAAATASSLRPSWTCAVPVASLYAYTHRDINTLVGKDGCKCMPVGLKRD